MDLPIKNGDYQRVPCTISDWSPVSRWCVADAGYVPCRAPWTRLRRVLAAWCAHCADHCYHPFLGVPWGFLKWGIRKTMAFNTKMFQFRMMWCATPCFRHLHMLVVIFTILYSSILFYIRLCAVGTVSLLSIWPHVRQPWETFSRCWIDWGSQGAKIFAKGSEVFRLTCFEDFWSVFWSFYIFEGEVAEAVFAGAKSPLWNGSWGPGHGRPAPGSVGSRISRGAAHADLRDDFREGEEGIGRIGKAAVCNSHRVYECHINVILMSY